MLSPALSNIKNAQFYFSYYRYGNDIDKCYSTSFSYN